ncbi:MAG: hypothetical protein EOO70_00610, partial [Myxococcaceae bacterium]
MPWRIREAGGEERGPFKKDEILEQIRLGLIDGSALISKAKAAPWEPIVAHPDFAKALGRSVAVVTSAALAVLPAPQPPP